MLIAGKAVKGKDEVDRFMLVNMLNMFSITKEGISLTASLVVSFIGGGNRSTGRKPKTSH
jgi:hypothetical protein